MAEVVVVERCTAFESHGAGNEDGFIDPNDESIVWIPGHVPDERVVSCDRGFSADGEALVGYSTEPS
jgi:hypothetical protein